MMGAGGSYHSGYAPYSTLAQASAVSGQNYSDYVYTNNVSAFYLVRYNFTTNTSNYTAVLNSKDLIETVIVSPHPQAIYRYNLNASFGGYTVTNATMNGLTYSYLGGSQYGINSTSMIGWKNGEVVYVIATGSYIPQQTLATVVSGDMP